MNYPIIFSKFETDFTNMGVAVLENANNVKIKKVVNGEFSLSFILPRNDPKWAYVLEEYFVLVDTQLYRIRTFDEARDNGGRLLSNVQCEHVWYDANDCKFIPDFEMIGATPTQTLEAAFSGTRFTIGTVDASLANTDITLSKTNPAAVVNKLIENVGGELERNNYTISLKAEIGSNNGVEFRTGKNNAEIKKTTDSKGLCTRLYPYGVDDLEITSVNATAYLDSQYINNYDYIHTRFIDYRDIDDPTELKTKALAEFSTADKDGIDKPKVTIEMSVVELKKLSGRLYESFDCGDIVRAIDEDINLDYNTRIMEYECYPYEAKRSSVVLANFRNNLGKLLANLADTRNQVQRVTTPSGKLKAAWFENIKSVLQSEIQTGLTKKCDVYDHGSMWVDNLENPTSAMVIVNGKFAIADSKKVNGDWDWKVFGTGSGFTADLINAGVVRIADALYIENEGGTVSLKSDGLRVSQTDARAAFLNNAISLQVREGEAWVNELYFDAVAKKFYFNGLLTAQAIEAVKANIDIVVSNTIITQTLAAEKGNIAELTVDQLDTSDKVQNYLLKDTDLEASKADVNYIKAYDQHIEFITAVYADKQHWTTYPKTPVTGYPYQAIISAGANTRLIVSTAKWYYYFSGDTQLKSAATGKMYQLNAGVWEFVSDAANYSYTTVLQANYDIYNDVSLSTVLFAATHSDHVQLEDRYGNLIYWVDDTHTGTTLDVTAYPVFVYVYDEYIKMKQSFEEIDGAVIPIVTYGTGIGNVDHPERGRGFMFKDTNGMVMRYVTAAGVVQDIRNGENGIEFVGDTSNNYYSATNATEITVNTSETVVCTKDIAFSSRSKIIVNFSCTIQTTGGALNCKAKVYINGVALTFQPEAYQASANKWVISFTDDKKGVASGTKTIAVKLVTDANSGTVAIGQSKMIVTVFVDPMPSLTNVTGFTATVISATQINLAWTNPT